MRRHALCWLLLLLPGAALAEQASDDSALQERPRVGLVLSGGGARGAAHIGVLKVLESNQIPVDVVVGTSMGAVVGGLYASGLSALDIERFLSSVNWQDAFRDRPPRRQLVFRRKREDQDFLVRFPLGISNGDFKLPKGLIQGQKLDQTLRALTLPVAARADFDDLPTAFRAVATDLETGQMRVLETGDLTDAMRASLAAPGIFNPVEVDGRWLVDGGLSGNLPVDVARQMGVDVLIVVDVGFPLLSRRELNSVAVISNQMLAILIRRNSEQQRATLTERDILITPALGSASSFDFQNVRKAIEQGEQAGRDLLPRLIALAVSPNEYARRLAMRSAARQVPTRVDFVRTDLASERYRETLQAYFGEFAGQALNAPELDARLTSLYGRGDFESLDYLWVRDGSRQGLEMRARRNSYGPNYIRFGLNLEDDFRGNSNFTAAARFVMTELSRRGAEWTWDLQVGERPVIATEYYWPLDQRQRWFLTPRARFSVRNVPLRVNDDVVAQFRLRDFSYGIDAGREFGEWGELRVGVQWAEGRARLRVGDPQLAAERFDVRQWFARFSVDQLDDVNFPRSGQSLTAEYRSETSRLAGVDAADFVTFDGLIARSSGRNTGVLWLSGGSTLDATQSDPRNLFTLGGFLNLSGVSPDSISGRHFAIARGLYYRQIGRAGAGFLNVPTYLGVSYEAGNVWDRRRDISFSDARQNGSLFLGLDTLLGPVYLGAGWNDAGNSAFYLFLGRTF